MQNVTIQKDLSGSRIYSAAGEVLYKLAFDLQISYKESVMFFPIG